MIFLISFYLITSLIQYSESANFLVYCPLFAHSHHKFLSKIADNLSEAGHNVTFLAPIIAQKYEKVKYLEHTKDIIYIQPDDELRKLGELMGSGGFSKYWTKETTVFSMIPSMKLFHKMFFKIYEILKKDLKILDELKNRKFDAMIYEVIAFNAIAIQQYLEIKTLLPVFSVTHSSMLSYSIGEPASPSTLSSALSPFGDEMTFQERLMNTVCTLIYRILVKPPVMITYSYPYEEINQKESEARSPFVFLNSNPYLDFPRPILTKTVLIGGISVNVTEIKKERLNEEYNEILNRRKKTVLISFGSIMFSKDMPENFKTSIINVINSFPNVTFIWKYESDDVEFSRGLENLHFSKWVPQTALLADSRLSVFITHAGLGSINELSYIGKPAILVPIYADQLRNAKMLESHNGSISIDKKSLGDFYILRNTLDNILSDKGYKMNAGSLARKLENQPFSPKDLLLKHAEFGAQFGELPSLDPYSHSVKCYAENEGYTFRLIRDSGPEGSCQQKDHLFRRHCLVSDVLLEFKTIMFLDADIGVVNPKRKLEEFFDDDVDLIFYDRYQNWEIATGSYIVKNTEYARNFLSEFANYESKLQKDSLHGDDNGAIHMLLAEKILPPEILSASECPEIYKNSKSFSDLFHFEACIRNLLDHHQNSQRIKILKKGTGWVRDGWLTNSQWNPEVDFMIHGWKMSQLRSLPEWELKPNPISKNQWYNPLDSESLKKCIWKYEPRLIGDAEIIRRSLKKIEEKVEELKKKTLRNDFLNEELN